MKEVTLIATCTFGLEAIVKREILKLGFDNLKVSDGKVEFLAQVSDIAKVNLWLRCAERILLKLSEFEVLSFEDFLLAKIAATAQASRLSQLVLPDFTAHRPGLRQQAPG